MSLCLATASVAVPLALQAFTLTWTHSVERTEWRERWGVRGAELVFEEGRVRGSGAGMDPPEGSVLQDGWWIYRHTGAGPLRVPVLRLAVSGATGSGWRLCSEDGACRDLEAWLARDGLRPRAIEIRPGPACTPLHPLPKASGPT
jgi:hypothetical protein